MHPHAWYFIVPGIGYIGSVSRCPQCLHSV
ncbi:uncharacterized protein METZ01_LOCUS426794, partial [marine metagenome]